MMCRATLRAFVLGLLLATPMGAACAGTGTQDDEAAKSSYQAATRFAAEGRLAEGLAALEAAVATGYANYFSLRWDPALKALRDAPGWAAFIEGFRQHHPWTAALDSDMTAAGFPWLAYAKAYRATAAGHEPPEPLRPTHRQMYSYLATFVGEYAEASRVFSGGMKPQDVETVGIAGLKPAMAQIVALARDRRVVMLNEPHGHSHVRALNFLVVRELRKLGFTHLALETLAYEPAEGDGCRATRLSDHGLHARGHALLESGYYTNDPVFAELVRVALAEGFTLVAYDFSPGGIFVAEREQKQAENLACLVQEDPDARLVVIGGGGHISEEPDHRFPGGMMGARFKTLTGIDPLTINTSVTLLQGDAITDTSPGFIEPGRDGQMAGQPYLALKADGSRHARTGYDLLVFAPWPAEREVATSWLTLGGHRRRTLVGGAHCGEQTPCLVEARRVGESDEAVPADRCVSRVAGRSCALFLPAGDYRVTASNDAPAVVATIEHAQP